MTLPRISMQVTVPHSEYGECQFFIPPVIYNWCAEYGLEYRYVRGISQGSGYTNGVTNCESIYMVDGITETDAIAFKIQFPECKVVVAGQT